jgi:hypothetical protein
MDIIESYNKQVKRDLALTISHLYSNSAIPDNINKVLLNRLLWFATETNDEGKRLKYKGCPYWSSGAVTQLKNNIKRNEKNIYHNLRHEHSVPKKIIVNRIMTSDKSASSIFNLLDWFAHSVIVSLEEDQGLNDKGLRSGFPVGNELLNNNKAENVFQRYIAADIKVYKIGIVDPKTIDPATLKNYPLLS